LQINVFIVIARFRAASRVPCGSAFRFAEGWFRIDLDEDLLAGMLAIGSR
jgi:hypothetical protein